MSRKYDTVIVRLDDGTYKLMALADIQLPEHRNWSFIPSVEDLALKIFAMNDVMKLKRVKKQKKP